MKTNYGELTVDEVRQADKDRVVILSVSATEDHGSHMPLDTDTVLGMAIAKGAVDSETNRSSPGKRALNHGL